MVHLNDLDTPPTPLGSSPLYPQVPPHIHELGEMGNKAKRRKQRLEDFGEHIEGVAKRALRRVKCIHALKRRHWQAIVDEIQYGEHGYKCFGEYPLKRSDTMCHSYLKAGEVGCEACVIVTKLMEVLDE